MKVLFDTNVIIDALSERNETYKYSQHLLNMAIDGDIEGYICSNQITDIYYILRKYFDNKERRQFIKTLSNVLNIIPLLPSYITYCVNSEIEDYEDAIIEEMAKENMMNCIVTNDLYDFEKARVEVLNPKELFSLINISKGQTIY